MSSPLSNQVEQALAELERQKAAIDEIQGGLHTVYSTVTAKNRAVAVTVDSRGAVTAIKFPTSAYRTMAGPELGELLVDTIEAARGEAMARTVAAFESLLPAGLPMMDLLTGGVDPEHGPLPMDQLLNEMFRTAGPADDPTPTPPAGAH
ncbi:MULTISPECIES: YbaB/EbfC family nucleoid-associated protein [unclassified Micromonospora]|uniref:YbaB/EbfC family nucleoid-associated protein n=1 Tax=unclassified Micromonospora TaxID=2617518 RepID=UPI001C5F34C5|nr:YbaB/EbfC family nucleoid-associated protein [Micromonospora sp. RL09-050-HVF-A]MBW4701842.1 YbaB/EbfC family nucleoid-associated protein [Micromonospora sp. RL09-050-HVF-A]